MNKTAILNLLLSMCEKSDDFRSDVLLMLHRLQERQLEQATGNQVTVRMLFAPINPADLNMISGTYPIQPKQLPAVGGSEGLGRVVAVGDRVSTLKVGDLVIPGSPSLGK